MHTFTPIVIRPGRVAGCGLFHCLGLDGRDSGAAAGSRQLRHGHERLRRAAKPAGRRCELEQGMYFAVNGGNVSGGQGSVIMVAGYQSLWQIGGPLSQPGDYVISTGAATPC